MSGNKLLARGGPRAVGLDVKGFVSYQKCCRSRTGPRWSEIGRKENIGPAYYIEYLNNQGSPFPEIYGYELSDLNGNGLPELILGVQLEGGNRILKRYMP